MPPIPCSDKQASGKASAGTPLYAPERQCEHVADGARMVNGGVVLGSSDGCVSSLTGNLKSMLHAFFGFFPGFAEGLGRPPTLN